MNPQDPTDQNPQTPPPTPSAPASEAAPVSSQSTAEPVPAITPPNSAAQKPLGSSRTPAILIGVVIVILLVAIAAYAFL